MTLSFERQLKRSRTGKSKAFTYGVWNHDTPSKNYWKNSRKTGTNRGKANRWWQKTGNCSHLKRCGQCLRTLRSTWKTSLEFSREVPWSAHIRYSIYIAPSTSYSDQINHKIWPERSPYKFKNWQRVMHNGVPPILY